MPSDDSDNSRGWGNIKSNIPYDKTRIFNYNGHPIYCMWFELDLCDIRDDDMTGCHEINEVSECRDCEYAYVPLNVLRNKIQNQSWGSDSLKKPEPAKTEKRSRFEDII